MLNAAKEIWGKQDTKSRSPWYNEERKKALKNAIILQTK